MPPSLSVLSSAALIGVQNLCVGRSPANPRLSAVVLVIGAKNPLPKKCAMLSVPILRLI